MKIVRRTIEIAVVVFLIGSVAGSALGQPIFVSYVETGSMSPTLEPGDGFVAVPAVVSGTIERNDVVVFDAEYIHGGELVTHRVIDKSSDGYITRGDANPFPDQSVGEPPVTEDRIVATALQVNGEVVVIPQLGAFAKGTRNVVDMTQRHLAATFGLSLFRGPEGLILLVSLSILAYTLFASQEVNKSRSRGRDTSRSVGTDPRLYVIIFVLVLISGATVSMTMSSGTRTYSVRAEKVEHAIYSIHNGILPTTVILESETDGIHPETSVVQLESNEQRNVSITISPSPGGIGAPRKLSEYRYPAVVPTGILYQLHTIHPWLARVAIDAVLGISFYLFGAALVGSGRLRDRRRDGPATNPLSRFLRKL
jgi:signal peptidase